MRALTVTEVSSGSIDTWYGHEDKLSSMDVVWTRRGQANDA